MPRRVVTPSGAMAIEGLDDRIKGLKALDSKLPRAVSKASREVVKNPVLVEARKRWAGQRIRPSQAASAIRASATAKAGGLVLRGSAHPYAMGVEMGSDKFAQFRRFKGSTLSIAPGSDSGYVVQPAIRDTLPEVERKWGTAVDEAIAKALTSG